MEFDENLYDVLGVAQDATEDQIKSAYRKLVLVKHPDKRPDDKEKAQLEFQALHKAYEVLMDAPARKAYDDVLNAQFRRTVFKTQRSKEWEAERKKFKDKLDEAERAAETRRGSHREDNEVDAARKRLQAELERLRRNREKEQASRRGEVVVDLSSDLPSSAEAASPLSCVRDILSRSSPLFTSPVIRSDPLPATPVTLAALAKKEEMVFAKMRAKAANKKRKAMS